MPQGYIRKSLLDRELRRVHNVCEKAQVPNNNITRDERLIILGGAMVLNNLQQLRAGECGELAQDLDMLDEWDLQVLRDNRRGY